MGRMRLLHTIPDFWPYVRRGSERTTAALAKTMSQRGHEVTVMTRTPGAHDEERLVDDYRVRYAAGRRTLERFGRLNPLEGFALTAARSARRDRYDLWHAHYITDAYGLSLVRGETLAPLLLTLHGMPDRPYWEEHDPRVQRWFRRVLERATCVTVETEVAAARMREQFDYDPLVIPPGIFVDAYQVGRRRPEAPAVVCAAALDEPRKRHDVLVEAFAVLAADDPDVRLVLAGQGDPARVARLVASLPAHVGKRVELTHASNGEIADVYARCTVGALTSRLEVFGLVVVEYLASGLPAVVSDDGGSPEILTPGTGLTFPEGDAAACARALRTALDMAVDPATEDRCRARARTYDWSVMAPRYEEMYRRLAG